MMLRTGLPRRLRRITRHLRAARTEAEREIVNGASFPKVTPT